MLCVPTLAARRMIGLVSDQGRVRSIRAMLIG